MNYKILAVSGIISITVLAVGLNEVFNGQESEMAVVERVTTVDMAEPMATHDMAPSPAVMAPPLQTNSNAPNEPVGTMLNDLGEVVTQAVNRPKIAYRFGYGFKLPEGAVKPLQDRHADMCETRGPNVCRIISMQQSDDSSVDQSGSLHLAVAAPLARAFGKDLTRTAEGADGKLVSSSIDGEDLSKQIVDTEARLRTRIVLRDRLMDVLRNRRGTVAELVEAERGVAAVNEEIDQARSWLSEMNGRVDFSQMHITYTSGVSIPVAQSDGFLAPVTSAFASAGGTIGAILGALIRLLTILLPLLLLGWLGVRTWRALGRPGSKLFRSAEFGDEAAA